MNFTLVVILTSATAMLPHGHSIPSGPRRGGQETRGGANVNRPRPGRTKQKGGAKIAYPHGITPLMEAAARNDVGRVRDLLAGGADVNASDTVGYTALLHAAARLSGELLRVLSDAGADVNAKAKNGDTAVLIVLGQIAHLPPDVPPEGIDNADEGTLLILKALIKKGAKVNVKNEQGETPLKLAGLWAEHFGRPRILELLKRSGARE